MPRYRFKNIGNGACIGSIEMDAPGAPGRVSVQAVGNNKADALGRAAVLAERIATDPAMAALLQRGTSASMTAAKGLAAAAQHGPHVVGDFARRIDSPGKRALAIALHRDATRGRQQEVGWFPIVLAAATFLASKEGQQLVGQVSTLIVKASEGNPKAQAKLEVVQEHSKRDPVLAKAVKIAALNVQAEAANVSDPEVGFDLFKAANFLLNPLEHIKHTQDIIKGRNPLDRLKPPKPATPKVPPPRQTPTTTPTQLPVDPTDFGGGVPQGGQQQQSYDPYYDQYGQQPYYEDYGYYDAWGNPMSTPYGEPSYAMDPWGRPTQGPYYAQPYSYQTQYGPPQDYDFYRRPYDPYRPSQMPWPPPTGSDWRGGGYW